MPSAWPCSSRTSNRYDPQIARLLDNLTLLGSHNLTALKRAVGVDAQELADMISEIKGLNPKPGLQFGTVQIQPVLPDVSVRPAHDGSWLVELNNDTLPRVLVNRSYYATVSKTAQLPKDRDYLLDCLQSANWLVKSLDQRARTILRVAEEIVRQQDGFLTYGIEHLKPLNLKTVADAISMHESTVSRVTSNKYMATPRGVFELKYFFTSAIASADGEESHSSEAVRHRIRQLIAAETVGRRAFRRQDRRAAEAGRHRHRPPHRRQVPRGAAHPLLRAAPAREADGSPARQLSRSAGATSEQARPPWPSRKNGRPRPPVFLCNRR